jgi:hypothetical protein
MSQASPDNLKDNFSFLNNLIIGRISLQSCRDIAVGTATDFGLVGV